MSWDFVTKALELLFWFLVGCSASFLLLHGFYKWSYRKAKREKWAVKKDWGEGE